MSTSTRHSPEGRQRAVRLVVEQQGEFELQWAAIKIGAASKIAPIDKLSVVLVALYAAVFLGERLNAREWLGIALVGAGVVVLGPKR